MNVSKTYKLNNGVEIPSLGCGTFRTSDDESGIQAIVDAIQLGYRHIDTAPSYKNEKSVGEAIKVAGVAREELFLLTKVPTQLMVLKTP